MIITPQQAARRAFAKKGIESKIEIGNLLFQILSEPEPVLTRVTSHPNFKALDTELNGTLTTSF